MVELAISPRKASRSLRASNRWRTAASAFSPWKTSSTLLAVGDRHSWHQPSPAIAGGRLITPTTNRPSRFSSGSHVICRHTPFPVDRDDRFCAAGARCSPVDIPGSPLDVEIDEKHGQGNKTSPLSSCLLEGKAFFRKAAGSRPFREGSCRCQKAPAKCRRFCYPGRPLRHLGCPCRGAAAATSWRRPFAFRLGFVVRDGRELLTGRLAPAPRQCAGIRSGVMQNRG